MSLAWTVKSESGDIATPEGWTVRRIGDLVQLSNGYPFPSESFDPSGDLPLIRIRDLGDRPFETFVSHPIPSNAIIENGDIVIGMDGDFNLVRWTRGRAALNQRMCALRPRPGVDIRFIAYALPESLKIINDLTFSTTVKHLSYNDILSERILLPDLPAQRRIADFLDAETSRIDAIDNRRRTQIDVLQERYSVAVSELVTPGISCAHIRSRQWPWLPALIPAARLGYMARIQSGVTVHAGRSTTARDGEFPYLRVANVQNEHIDLTEVKTIRVSQDMADAATLHPGDVVMTEANGNPDNLGRGAIWDGAIENMIHQNHVFAIRTDRTKLIPEYLVALLSSIHGRRYFRLTSTQVGIATTSSSKVLGFPIPLRTLPEQEGVVTEYRLLRENAAKATQLLDRQRSLLAERRQALITAAVTGQFDVSTASGRNNTQGV